MPLTHKGKEIESNLKKEYGDKKGEEVLYAGKNKGTFTGIDSAFRYLGRLDRELLATPDIAPYEANINAYKSEAEEEEEFHKHEGKAEKDSEEKKDWDNLSSMMDACMAKLDACMKKMDSLDLNHAKIPWSEGASEPEDHVKNFKKIR